MSADTPTAVKICGVTDLADAELACSLGAWAVGMIFYEPSPRRCSIEQAAVICAQLRRRVELCGVFVNAAPDFVVTTADELGLTLLQLHGDEGPAMCAELARRTGSRVIKAVQVANPGDVRASERFHVDFHLFDARPSSPAGAQLRGGTGESFDWELVAARKTRIPLILSGGLHAGNVGEAITVARPWAVDVASGTEQSPGRKDPRHMREFFAAVAAADRERVESAQTARAAPTEAAQTAAAGQPTEASHATQAGQPTEASHATQAGQPA
jgi:phosphoribosylanthranilate isomerase